MRHKGGEHPPLNLRHEIVTGKLAAEKAREIYSKMAGAYVRQRCIHSART
ncbi:MAG TPA: hypothetical protein VEZ40_19595 [Pyrinomonadaceae bacterium]|nr:hypothetical protein [Pyrinomonadaceae bacterium]